MTSFLPAFKPSGAFNIPSPQKLSSSANSSFKPVTTFIVPPLSPKQSQLNELLTKRNNNKDLGDLLAKKFKPTNFSESGSIQGSPASKGKTEDGGSYENTSPMSEGSPLNMKEIIRRINPIPSFDSAQVQFNGLSRASNLFEDETENTLHVNTLSGSSLQIQSALRTLEKKILIQEEIAAQEARIKSLKATKDKPKIPPFPAKMIMNLPKEDPNFIYGNVEFPFLSISAPFSELHQLTEKLLSEAKLVDSSSLKKGAIEVEDELDKSSSSEDLLSSLLPTREETLRSEAEETSSPKKRSTKKTNKIIEEEKKVVEPVTAVVKTNQKKEKKTQQEKAPEKVPKKEAQPKIMVEEDEASLYRKPMYVFSNRSERQKSRWQSAQEEKLAKSGNVSDSDDEEVESIEVMFGGSKENKTPVGPQNQVDILMATAKKSQREKPKMMWDPSSHNEAELSKFFKDVKTVLKCAPTEQQMINILKINNNDVQRALKYAKTNKTKCLEKAAC